MRTILFDQNFLQLITLFDIKHLQDANEETVQGIISGLLPAGVTSCVLSGCQVTKMGNNYTVAPGYIYANSNIYPVSAHVLNTVNPPYWAYSLSFLPSDPVPLKNGNSHFAHQVGTAQLVINNNQDEIIGAYNEVYQLKEYIRNMANVGKVEMLASGFDMYDAQGAGLGYNAGWQICNGNNGAPDFTDRFIMGANDALSNIGTIGGASEVELTTEQMPRHGHNIIGADAEEGSNGYAILGDNVVTEGPTTGSDKAIVPAGGDPAGVLGNSEPHENRPPFYVLAFRQRVA